MNNKLTQSLSRAFLGGCLLSSVAFAQSTFALDSRLPETAVSISAAATTEGYHDENSGTLASTTTGGYGILSYQWSPTDYLDDPSLASPTIDFAALYSQQGNTPLSYTVVVTDENGCSASAETAVTVVVSLEESLSLPISLTVSPNPSAGLLHLSLSGEPLRTPLNLELIDALGRKVYTEDLGTFAGQLERDLDLSVLGQGVYHLSLSSSEGRTTTSIILQ